MLSLLTRQFPFFNSADDQEAILEIAAIFGINEMSASAEFYGN